MSAIRGKHNKSTERQLRVMLMRAAIRGWKLHPAGLPGNPDLVFAEKKLAIFVDGCFWHGCSRCGHIPNTNSRFWSAKIERNRERDRAATRTLKNMGWKVLRIWEHSFKTREEVQRVLKAVVTRLDT
jgi:DNA mismatch endonuclease (patch repair protein)